MGFLGGKAVLITGGTGTFGAACAERLLREFCPSRVVLYSRDEQKHVALARSRFPQRDFPQLVSMIGDVRDFDRLRQAMRGIDVVIHAAAMKHVDIAEKNREECIKTNVLGAQNVIAAAAEAGVARVVALSSDKAADPINAYGSTKLCSDELFLGASCPDRGTSFSVVRYGNVVGSAGSVVPYFVTRRGSGRLPITDPEMTRFLIPLDRAVDFVLASVERMNGGELFVPKCPSARIVDVATALAPQCKQDTVGRRPGEKLHECMIPATEAGRAWEFGDHYVILSAPTDAPPAGGTRMPGDRAYASNTNSEWLQVDDLRALFVGLGYVEPQSRQGRRGAKTGRGGAKEGAARPNRAGAVRLLK